METKLARIAQLSNENPNMVFTSVGHLIDRELLAKCHEEMDADKAVGIDGITKDAYSVMLEENLDNLMDRLKRRAYHPKPARRVEIPKDNGKTRPLSIYCYEDKIVQSALKRVLEAVFEPCFYEQMMGFRPGRSCHGALKMLDDQIGGHMTNWVLDADIRGFFDNIDHEWMMKFVGARIKDPRILRLVSVMLKAGVVRDMVFEPTEQGSGQGSVCSPILANIYMHYVLLWWFNEIVVPNLEGYAGIVNYADDFVVCFQYKQEAVAFYERLKHRMAHFGLSLAEEKCRLIEFGGFAENNRRHRGDQMRTMKTKEIIAKLNEILIGYYHYYGVYGNYPAVIAFRWHVLKSLFYWLNRRSQKKSYNWKGFLDMIKFGHPLVRPKSFYVYI